MHVELSLAYFCLAPAPLCTAHSVLLASPGFVFPASLRLGPFRTRALWYSITERLLQFGTNLTENTLNKHINKLGYCLLS